MICLKESFPHLRTRKLTRVEWCKIRRMMGKPRRCSQVHLLLYFLINTSAILTMYVVKGKLVKWKYVSEFVNSIVTCVCAHAHTCKFNAHFSFQNGLIVEIWPLIFLQFLDIFQYSVSSILLVPDVTNLYYLLCMLFFHLLLSDAVAFSKVSYLWKCDLFIFTFHW
jgi:hypothetical protein